MLVIKSETLMDDFMGKFYDELDYALNNWKKDVEKFSSGFIRTLGIPKAETQKVLDKASRMIVIYFKANPTLLADVYGTGSAMKDNIPNFAEYWNNRGSDYGQVNPARTSKEIQGRPAGEYTNIFGTTRTSLGKKVGQNIEGGGIKPIESNEKLFDQYFGSAIEIGNKFFKTTYLKSAISRAIKKVKMYNFIEEVK